MKRGIIIFLLVLVPVTMSAQRTDREYVRKGNRMYEDSLYLKAEENYLKALDKNSASINASYNLGNSYLYQQKGQEALDQYQKAVTVIELERDKLLNSPDATEKQIAEIKEKAAQAYHNIGTLMMASQNYAPAVAAFEQSLRNNPADHETRYNLALAMYLLKQQQQQNQDQNQDQNQEQQDQQQDQQQQQNQEQQQEQEQQQQQEQQDKEDMSRENAEQLLQAAMQDEKDVQERVQQMMQVQSKGELDKDW